jgi:hypothetical protein
LAKPAPTLGKFFLENLLISLGIYPQELFCNFDYCIRVASEGFLKMFDKPVVIPDRVSTLELSKLWIYKALKNLEQELAAEQSSVEDDPAEDSEKPDQDND